MSPPPLRILVIGKTRSGKSTLINRVGNIARPLDTSGLCTPDVNTPIPTPDGQFIFHEGLGFESGGQLDERITMFINQNHSGVTKLHAIWLCVEIYKLRRTMVYHSDHKNVMSSLDGVRQRVPVICVWTHFHHLVDSIKLEWQVPLSDPYREAASHLEDMLRSRRLCDYELQWVLFDIIPPEDYYEREIRRLCKLTHTEVSKCSSPFRYLRKMFGGS